MAAFVFFLFLRSGCFECFKGLFRSFNTHQTSLSIVHTATQFAFNTLLNTRLALLHESFCLLFLRSGCFECFKGLFRSFKTHQVNLYIVQTATQFLFNVFLSPFYCSFFPSKAINHSMLSAHSRRQLAIYFLTPRCFSITFRWKEIDLTFQTLLEDTSSPVLVLSLCFVCFQVIFIYYFKLYLYITVIILKCFLPIWFSGCCFNAFSLLESIFMRRCIYPFSPSIKR